MTNDGQSYEATVRFTQFHLRGNGAAHGGAIPLVFLEAMARLTNLDRTTGRTAFLNVDYRSVTLVGRDLKLRSQLDRVEGRKRFATAAIYDGDTLTAEATALCVGLNPGAA